MYGEEFKDEISRIVEGLYGGRIVDSHRVKKKLASIEVPIDDQNPDELNDVSINLS